MRDTLAIAVLNLELCEVDVAEKALRSLAIVSYKLLFVIPYNRLLLWS